MNLNPIERWSPQQARLHPFITGEKFTKPFVVRSSSPFRSMIFSWTLSACGSPFATAASFPFCRFSHKHVRSQTSVWWARSFSAQGYTSVPRCRLLQPAPCPASGFHRSGTGGVSGSEQCFPQSVHHDAAVTVAAVFLHVPCCLRRLGERVFATTGIPTFAICNECTKSDLIHLRASLSVLTHHFVGPNNGTGAPQQSSFSSGSNVGVSSHLNPNPPSNAYYPNSRTRANTINHMDRIPPALARLQHMSQDVISGRNALTPVLNRDDAIKEWERRQSGKAAAAQPYPQLEYLQQQAELVAASGIASWQQPATRYQPTQSSGLAHQYHPPAAIVVDDERRDAIMSNVRATAQGQTYMSSSTISNPPAAYTGASTTAGSRFTVTYPPQPPAASQSQSQQHAQPSQQQQQQQQQSPTSPFDSLDRRPDMGGLFVPLQPDHYQPYTGASVAGARGPATSSQPAVQPSFYDPAVAQQANAAPQRNPFSGDTSSSGGSAPGSGGANTTKDRRGSGMEFWPR